MEKPSALVAANLVATAFMTGLIWFVQVVHYPLMAGWPHDDFGRWEGLHRAATERVVVPMMLLEGITAAGLLARGSGLRPWVGRVGLALLVGIWASTFLIQVPCHQRLSLGWDESVHARLVASNWIRTILWSARLALVVAAVSGLRRPSDR
jgi:hypothetical protein